MKSGHARLKDIVWQPMMTCENLIKYADKLVKTALFYQQKLADGRIIYLARQHNTIQALPVKFGTENFAHLTGMIFDHRTASQMLNDLADGNFTSKRYLS